MQREHSIWLEAFSSYARVCARSIILQIAFISLLFFAPAFAAFSSVSPNAQVSGDDANVVHFGAYGSKNK